MEDILIFKKHNKNGGYFKTLLLFFIFLRLIRVWALLYELSSCVLPTSLLSEELLMRPSKNPQYAIFVFITYRYYLYKIKSRHWGTFSTVSLNACSDGLIFSELASFFPVYTWMIEISWGGRGVFLFKPWIEQMNVPQRNRALFECLRDRCEWTVQLRISW